jgi:hypothetical protein
VRAIALMWQGRIDEGISGLRGAIGHDVDRCTPRSIGRRCTLALLLNQAGNPDPDMARQLLHDAETLGHPTTLATAHHTYGTVIGPTDPVRALEHQRRAAQLAETTGAALVHGFALAALAALTSVTARDPGAHVRAIADVTAHYLHVDNHTHLRSFARGAIGPLAASGDDEGVLTLDAATSDQPAFGGRGPAIETAVGDAHRRIGVGEGLTRHGAALSDSQLVDWLRDRGNRAARTK